MSVTDRLAMDAHVHGHDEALLLEYFKKLKNSLFLKEVRRSRTSFKNNGFFNFLLSSCRKHLSVAVEFYCNRWLN